MPALIDDNESSTALRNDFPSRYISEIYIYNGIMDAIINQTLFDKRINKATEARWITPSR
jgi:hypothetical protein